MKVSHFTILVATLFVGFAATAKSAPAGKVTAKTKVAAKAKSKRMVSRFAAPSLLTYKQLKALSPKKRAGYLRSVRFALAQFERMQNGVALATRKTAMIGSLKDILAQFTWMDSAYADGAPVGMPIVNQGVDGRYSLSCSPMRVGTTSVPMIIDEALKLCVVGTPGGRIVDPYASGSEECSSFPGTKYISYNVGERWRGSESVGRCVTMEGWNALTPEIQRQLADQSWGGSYRATSIPAAQTYVSREAAVSPSNMPLIRPETRVAIGGAGLLPAADTAAVVANADTGEALRTTFAAPDAAGISVNVDSLVRSRAKGEEVTPRFSGGEWTCSNSNYQFVGAYGTCLKTEICEEGEGITVDGVYCIPTASYLAMSANQREAICPITPGAVTVTPRRIECSSSGVQEVDYTSSAAEATRMVLGGRLTAAELAQQVARQREASDRNAYSKARGEADLARMSADRAAAAVLAQEDERQAAVEAAAVDAEGNPPTATGGQCEWAPVAESCVPRPFENADTRKAFRNEYSRNLAAANQSLARCVVAGGFSTFVDNSPRTNQCVPSTRLEGTNLACTARGEILCNPLVYGVTAEGGAICVRGNGGSKEAVAATTVDCSGKVTPENFHEATGLSGEAWDEFKRNFEEAFKGHCVASPVKADFAKTFAAYFCNECDSIGRMIVAANQTYARSLDVCRKDAAATDAAPAAPADSAM